MKEKRKQKTRDESFFWEDSEKIATYWTTKNIDDIVVQYIIIRYIKGYTVSRRCIVKSLPNCRVWKQLAKNRRSLACAKKIAENDFVKLAKSKRTIFE